MSHGDGLARVLAAHKGKRRGGSGDWMLACPAHEDGTASLHVTQGRDGALCFCHAGCSTEAVCGALGLDYQDLFDDREAGPGGWRGGAVADDRPAPVTGGSGRPHQRPQEGRSPAAPAGSAAHQAVAGHAQAGAAAGPEERQPVTIAALAGRFGLSASWLRDAARGPGLREERGTVLVPYHDEAGRELFAKRRVALAGRDKYRMPRGQALALYGLDRLPAVLAMRRPVAIYCEGESDCWCLWASKLPALGVPGASACDVILAAHVRGLRRAYAVREPDEGGAKFVAALAERLRQVGYDGEPLLVVEMPDGLKDPGELHAADPGAFAARVRAACAAAKPLDACADVDEALLRMDTVTRRDVSFLWRPYVPAGKLTILAGLPGDGKSTIAAALSASITVGAKLPNSNGGPPAPPAGVLYFLAEDDPEETFGPRLEDNGADRSRVWAYNLARRTFTLEEAGYDFLRRAIVKHRPALVVFDPLSSFFGRKYDPNKAGDVRAALHPLVALVQETGCSCLAIAHPPKGGSLELVYRVAGSGAFAQIVRSVLSTYRDPAARPGEQAGVVAHAKHNLSAPGPSLRYVIEGTRLYWRGESPHTAQDLAHAAAQRPLAGGARAREEAVAFLREELRTGARYAAHVLAGAKGAMVSKAALDLARADLGVRTFKATAAGGGWMWRLPSAVAADAGEREERDGQPARERRRDVTGEREERDDDGEAVPI
jgi:DNA repair protein RadA/Sms